MARGEKKTISFQQLKRIVCEGLGDDFDGSDGVTMTMGELRKMFKHQSKVDEDYDDEESLGYEILSVDKTDLTAQSPSGIYYYYDVIVSVNGKKRRIPIRAKDDEDAKIKAKERIETGYKLGELEDWGFPIRESKRKRS